MDVMTLKNDVSTENIEIEPVQLSVEQLRGLELCMVGGGMGDVQQ